jgi:hypothetical protein
MLEKTRMASILDTDRFRGRETAPQGHGGDGGGGVDDILKRLGNVESAVADLRGDMREVMAVLPTLATKVEVSEVRGDIASIKAELPHLATKENVAGVRTEVEAVKAQIHASEARIIRWFIATSITIAALSFSIARFVS